jgi:putative DNA methylase
VSYRKKLIEVALPLDAINKAARVENNIHTGLPSNLHTWWSRKPLGVARAVIFSSLVDDPAEYLPPDEAIAKRKELFKIVSGLADVERSADEKLLLQAKEEISKSVGSILPSFWDPFCGGGSLPLEALRLGLPSVGSDLNPVAVFITRVLIELAPRQASHLPINLEDKGKYPYSGAKFEGLRRDVDYYSRSIHTKLVKRIGNCYPSVILPKKYGGGKTQAIAWIWARTVMCPNPSCGAESPLANKFWLSTHAGNKAYAVPVYQKENKKFSFSIHQTGEPPLGSVNRSGAMCLACRNPMPFNHIRNEGVAGRIGFSLMAIAADGPRGRIYLEPTTEHEEAARACNPVWQPDTELPPSALGFRVQKYGITKHQDLFTKRQMTVLSCLADTIAESRQEIVTDADGDVGYADLVHAFLALSLSRVAQTNNTLVRWLVRASGTSKGTPAFDRPIVSMTWEFSEGNVLGASVGSWKAAIKNPLTALNSVPQSDVLAKAIQHDVSVGPIEGSNLFVSTDPPYFDAIGYADLSDFFYIWLRKAMGAVHPDIFGTMLVPKSGDLTRDLGRKEVARNSASLKFLDKLHAAFENIRKVANTNFPVTVYYAFKQAEADTSDDEEELAGATGWETLLESLLRSGFQITGTWPLHTEATSRLRAIGSNALAASIVLVCRNRPENASSATKGEFLAALKNELPSALKELQASNIAPVDLAQAALGPGMAIYTRYSKVLDASANSVGVRDALALINQTLDRVLSEQEGDFDADSRWAVAWFEDFGFDANEYGIAEVLSKAKNTSVAGMVEAKIVVSKAGKVRLRKPDELPEGWDPDTDLRISAWEVVHQLVRALNASGEIAAAALVAKLGSKAEIARELAYRLYTICERKKRASDAQSYNALVQSWPEITRLAREGAKAQTAERNMFEQE